MTSIIPIMLDPTVVTSGILTTEDVKRHVSLFCLDPIDVRTFSDRGPVWVCGCGRCPTPDPTPEQLTARIEAQRWRWACDTSDA